MTLTPLEQLEFFVPEPKRAFSQLVETLLRDRFGSSAVQGSNAQGCIAVQGPVPGLPDGLSLFQPKYFCRYWQGSQRQQLRSAFQQAMQDRDGSVLQRWVLCVPTAITAKDRRWFDGWRKTQPLAIEALDGDEILKMLQAPAGRRTLELLRSWGVTIPGEESVRVTADLRVRAAEPGSGLTYYLYVSVSNGGGHAAPGLKVELAHSLTGHVSLRQDEREWADEGQGSLNPRALRACRPLLPQEERLVAVIPLGTRTPWPVHIRIKLSNPQGPTVEQHLTLERAALESATRFDFAAGPGSDLELIQPEPISAFAA
ncbi:MAG: hypothetical protein JO069_04885 [Verrucomicrobia bacterium]|nr:hypothetical protein [Verrucomicrobiota bacterium]